mmetsp:Transcript_37570/g.103680  ORF Transcript_37570/g.103680 Transcript_37570/m.103680 type:complete len:273 (-) Transcript_37570:232-1050(-)|eukprot:4187133-Prymnesium_polylepis.1
MGLRRGCVVLIVALLLAAQPVGGKRRKKKKASGTADAGRAAMPPPGSRAMKHHERGVMAHVQGDIDGAKRELRAAIDAHPTFAYAYYRLGFVLHEQQEVRREAKAAAAKANGKARALPAAGEGEGGGEDEDEDDPVPLLRAAVGIDGRDEMAYHALGRALRDGGRYDEAGAAYLSVAARLNPQSAQAYWAMGKLAALTVDEFESDPDDPNDPSHHYAVAARLQPAQYLLDGTRQRRVEPGSEERKAKEAQEKREALMAGIKDGSRQMKYAGE